MRNGAQPAEQMLEPLVAEQQWIAATEQNVAYLGMVPDIFDLFVELRMKIVASGVADEARARAITAIRGATVSDEKQNAIGIAMNQARHRRVRIFAAGIGHFPRRCIGFFDARDDLPTNRTIL